MLVSESLNQLQQLLKKLPGLGFRSAERVALHLLVEKPDSLAPLIEALKRAGEQIQPCPACGNLSEGELCSICADAARSPAQVCVVSQVSDLMALERSGAYRGHYHVLNGKLSPIQGVGPEQLNFAGLEERLNEESVEELILALSNDIEGEATCHYIQDRLTASHPGIRLSRIGFGLPSGSGLNFADSVTVRSALEGRRLFHP